MNPELLSGLRSDKIRPRHLDRLAVVYVRQSSLRQVQAHQESTKLQYGLCERAVALGWPRERVLVIDDDLGRSAASAEGRPGFQRLVADVGLDRVGIVLGVDMSRLARSCMDWYHLLEVCSLFGTLIADLDGLYDPAVYNDRLLLGLKGTMSEAELHTIRQRLYSGKRAKAERGEMEQRLPLGFVRRPSGEVVQDPNERVREVVALIFATFQRQRTVYGVLRYLNEYGIEIPVRETTGPNKGELTWRSPCQATLNNMIHNPAYAGVYAWGRRPTDPRRKRPGRTGTGRVVAGQQEWAVCLQDRLPAYISWEQYQANVEQLQRNRGSVRGTPRQGSALLAGVVWCGKCGRRMTTHYSGTDQRLRYDCMAEARARLGRPCQTLCGTDLDRLVEELVLQAVQPAALEVSLRVAADLDAERTQLERHWRQRLEQAQYQADRARRQYAAVEPEHRLVARQLEREWNDALAAAAQLQDEYERYLAQRSRAVTAAERAEIQRLAEDIPAIWRAPTTTVADRKVIIGLLVERVVVTVVGQSELVEVVVHWQGGHESQALLRRPMRYAKNISNRDVFGARAIELQQQGMTLGQIAECLNQEGFRAPRGGVLTTYTVHATLAGLGLTRKKRPSEPRRVEDRRPNEVPLLEAAARVGMPAQTLRVWLKSGKAQGRVAHHQGHPVTLIRLDDTELQRLRDLRSQPAKGKAYTV